MKKALFFSVTLSVVLAVGSSASADWIMFTPPTDPSGSVFSTNFNDRYSAGRGMSFLMTDDVMIDSVGIYHDLTGIDLSYELAETTSTSGVVTIGQTVLRSGNGVVTTSGLEFIEFAIAPLTLQAGKSYHLDFTFSGPGNQNFFYCQDGWPVYGPATFDLGAFTLIDGTAGGYTQNFVLPRMGVNAMTAAVPAPGAILLGALGAGLVGWMRKRNAL